MKHWMLQTMVAALAMAFFMQNSYGQDKKAETQPQKSKSGTEVVAHGPGFVDANGDGYNDNAPDADGDGIPNGQDPDYVRMNPGRGQGTLGFIDEDGDGINDRAQDFDNDGIPNGQDPDYVRSAGTGTGNKYAHGRLGSEDRGFRGRGNGTGIRGAATGKGVCDATGPKGKRGR